MYLYKYLPPFCQTSACSKNCWCNFSWCLLETTRRAWENQKETVKNGKNKIVPHLKFLIVASAAKKFDIFIFDTWLSGTFAKPCPSFLLNKITSVFGDNFYKFTTL